MENNNIEFKNKTGAGFFEDPLTWMVHHSVSANLMMVILLVLGFALMMQIKKEVFPDFANDTITISVSYPGSTPSTLETAVAIPIENAISGVDNLGDIKTTITYENVSISAEVLSSSKLSTAYRDIQNKVAGISTFPTDMPKPVVMQAIRDMPLVYMMLYGNDATQETLKNALNTVRDVFAQDPETGILEVPGDEDYKILVEIPQNNLIKYNLTLDQVGKAIAASGVDLAAGTIRGDKEKLELYFNYRKDIAEKFKDIIIISSAEGTPVYLKDIAKVVDTFNDNTDIDISYNNLSSLFFYVNAKQGQTPYSISAAVKKAVERLNNSLPDNLNLKILQDSSQTFKDRAEVLVREGFIGIILVIVVLAIFLESKLAFWTSFGIPISFLGAFFILTPIMAPLTGFSINVISLFAFIIVLGIVVDDAIMVGENIFHHKELMPDNPKLATSNGVKEVASSAFFSIFTNIAAFMPLAFLPGVMGKFLKQIPIVVIAVLLISLFESLFILPARIAFKNTAPSNNIFARAKRGFNNYFDKIVRVYYVKVLNVIIKHRYIALAIIFGCMMIFFAYMKSGRMGVILMPEAEGDTVTLSGTFPATSTLPSKVAMRKILVSNALSVLDERGGKSEYVGVEADVIDTNFNVRIFLRPGSNRPYTAGEILKAWQQKNGELTGFQKYSYSSSISMPGGDAQITIRFTHQNTEILMKAVEEIKNKLASYSYVDYAETDQTEGYSRYNFSLNQLGYSLGLTPSALANQIYNFVYGYKAIEQVKGRNAQTVMVSLPKSEIDSRSAVNNLLIKTSSGAFVPLRDITTINTTVSEPKITRLNFQRRVEVYGYVTPDNKSSGILNQFLSTDFVDLQAKYNGLQYSKGGRQEQFTKVGVGLLVGFVLTLIAIYTALAMFFDSYIQPLIIMVAIPFGFVGAIIGHALMGFPLSMPSLFGLLALSGIVVNASMIIIYFTNIYKKNNNISSSKAIVDVSVRRFRPILLTALTAFFGMLPTILSSSSQVAFLRPIAVAIGFGVIFTTIVILLFMPVFYLLVEDIKGLFKRKKVGN